MEKVLLDDREKAIVAIAALSAKGDIDNLNTSLHTGLDAGLTISEINEVLIQVYAYAGLPRCINALNAFIAVQTARQHAGIQDVQGREPHPLPAQPTKYQIGCENQAKLVGVHPANPALALVPAIDTIIKEHLFADIWGRDNLDFKSRELVTVAVLTCLGGVNAQLKTHLNIGLQRDFSFEQFRELILVLAEKVGAAEAENAAQVLTMLENERKSAHNLLLQADMVVSKWWGDF